MNNQNYQNYYSNQQSSMTPDQWAVYQQQQQLPYYGQQWAQNYNQFSSAAFQQTPVSIS
jgi:hypothetical protein